jgi:REP-associated tyrosine transposase
VSHAFVKNHIHLVFSTKDRTKSIAKDVQPELWSYMAGICRNQGMAAIAINGMEDHTHLPFHLPPTMSLAKAVQLIKANSSKWMNEHGRRFAWQEGYSAFGVSVSKYRCCGNVHPQSGTTPPQDDIRTGVSSLAEEARLCRRLMSEIRAGYFCRRRRAGLALFPTVSQR